MYYRNKFVFMTTL